MSFVLYALLSRYASTKMTFYTIFQSSYRRKISRFCEAAWRRSRQKSRTVKAVGFDVKIISAKNPEKTVLFGIY